MIVLSPRQPLTMYGKHRLLSRIAIMYLTHKFGELLQPVVCFKGV
jgi:hypothetical protein